MNYDLGIWMDGDGEGAWVADCKSFEYTRIFPPFLMSVPPHVHSNSARLVCQLSPFWIDGKVNQRALLLLQPSPLGVGLIPGFGLSSSYYWAVVSFALWKGPHCSGVGTVFVLFSAHN